MPEIMAHAQNLDLTGLNKDQLVGNTKIVYMKRCQAVTIITRAMIVSLRNPHKINKSIPSIKSPLQKYV